MAAHARTFDNSDYQRRVDRAARRFRSSGRGPYYFCRGKLGSDPVFAALLRDVHIPGNARIVDLGCGQGVLAALLAESDLGHLWTLRGFDLRRTAIGSAQRAMRDMAARTQFELGDIEAVQLPPCDVVVILDVLHYIDHGAQASVLARAFDALAADGRLLLRIGDASGGWRSTFTLITDWIVTIARGTFQRRFWCRPLSQWIGLLEAIGFEVQAQPMSAGTPFANVLLIAKKRRARSASVS
ncbi:MAG: class I SAM-dependent methyltransferase [Burkholderiaceae bacterium]|nr:class I SAM-dependent methyltransferase [Burkholderiaceae bacterium]